MPDILYSIFQRTDDGPMSVCLVYITASDAAEAVSIGRDLVERRLAACANVHGPITSIYRWQDEIQQDQETVLLVHRKYFLDIRSFYVILIT